MSSRTFAVLLLLVVSPLAAQQPAVTLEGLLSAPFPTKLSASGTGGKLAWVQRNVHVEQLIFPDEVHSFLRYASWLRAFQATAEFFDRRLGSGN